MNFYLSSNYALDKDCEVKSYKGKPGLEVPDEVVCTPKSVFSEPADIALLAISVIFVVSVIVLALIKRQKK